MCLVCSNYCDVCLMVILIFSSFLLCLSIGSYCEKELLHSPIYLIIYYICMDTWIFILFYGLKSNNIIIYFVIQIIPTLVIGSSLRLPPVFFHILSSYFQHFLTFCHHNKFQNHLVFTLTLFWNQPLLLGVPFFGEWCLETKIWAMSVFIITGLLLLQVSLRRHS